MAQRVVRPVLNSSGSAGVIELLAELLAVDFAAVPSHRRQPLPQIRLYLHETPPCHLCFGRCNFDQVVVEVNVAPIQTLNLSAAQTGERADCHTREQLRGSAFKQPGWGWGQGATLPTGA